MQKYSLKCKVKGRGSTIIRRPLGSSKFMQLPKQNQFIYITSNQRGYFWDKRYDSADKSNLRFDYQLGSTFITGSNHDIILLNGKDASSFMLLQSITTDSKLDKFTSVTLAGQQGILQLIASDVVNVGSNRIMLSASSTMFLSSKKDFMLNGQTTMTIAAKNGLKITSDASGKNDKTQPMVLGNQLKQWQQDLITSIQTMMSNLIPLIQTGIRGRGPTGPRAAATFFARANPLPNTSFTSNNSNLQNILSQKHKVD